MTSEQHLLEMSVDFLKTNGETVRGRDGALRIESGTAGTWIIRLKVLAEKIAPGTEIALKRYNFQIAHNLQNTHPKRRDYVTVHPPSSSELDLAVQLLPSAKGIILTLQEGSLKKNDVVTIRIGDRSEGSVGSETFWSATRGRLSLTVRMKDEAEGSVEAGDPAEKAAGLEKAAGSYRAEGDFLIHITYRSTPECLRLLGPTVIRRGEAFSLHLIVFDINRNPIESFSGKARFDAPRGVVGLEQEYRFAERDRGVIIIKNVKVSQTGVYRIGVSLEGVQALSTLSNPIICQDEPAERVFWGDLHAHGWGDSSMFLMHDNTDKLRPSSRHDQARRIGRYDYAAPSAMSMPDSGEREEIWNAYQEAYQENDEPGRYVPFMAMEMHPGETGDRVLIFYENAELPFSCREDVQRVYREFARREDTILETHIGGAPPYFEEFMPEEEELVEVTSAFANAEWLLQKMLSLGFHPGITGASDLHLGLLGAPRAVETFRGRFGFADRRLNVRDSGFGSGPLGAIAAERCTREALWKSLKSRNGYATTGDRIYLNLNAGSHRMGEETNLPDRFPLTLSICGQDRIERVDLVVGDRLAESFYPDKMDVRIEMDFDRTRLPPGHWFYFRIKQSNAEYAWTTPVWLPRQEGLGDRSRTWPAWNHTEPPAPVPILRSGPAGEPDAAAALQRYRKDLEDYLEVEGDCGAFGEILPVGIAEESMGTCARFISRTTRENFPVTIRWFFEYEIPKLRIDWGYESFGVVDCHRGP